MSSNSTSLGSLDRESLDPDTPAPHRCPFWLHYLLVNPLRRLLEPTGKLLGSTIEPGMTVVEPGCGFGYVSLAIARMVGPEGRVISVDIEPRAVERLEKRARRAGLQERVLARTCEARDLGLAEYAGRVDRVVVVHALHELEGLPGYLAQFRALLKPTGRLLVVEPLGHVSREQFADMMSACGEAGFTELEAPDVGRGRLAALLAPEG